LGQEDLLKGVEKGGQIIAQESGHGVNLEQQPDPSNSSDLAYAVLFFGGTDKTPDNMAPAMAMLEKQL